MKILFVNTSDTNGGAARAAMRIMQAVEAEGSKVQMLVKQKTSSLANVLPLDAFLPHNSLYKAADWLATKLKNKLQHARWWPYRHSQDGNYKSDLRGTYLGGAMRSIDYDVLHLHWINLRFVRLEDLPTDKPIVWTLHDCWPFSGVCHYFLDCQAYTQSCGCCPQLGSNHPHDLSHQVWKQKKAILSKLDLHIVCPSRWLAECARESSILKNADIRVIPNCIDTSVFCPQAKLKSDTIRSVILFGAVNATKDRIKGFSELIEALNILDDDGYEADLVVFGAEEQELKLSFTHIRVRFEGYVQDTNHLVRLYQSADVMVVPSLTENLSCAIMEALSCGTPVCCFDIGGNRDMVKHQQNGYLAREKDTSDLAIGIRSCIAHSEAWGASARQWVMEHYSLEIVGKQYCQLYNQIASSHHGICMEDL